MRHKHDLTTTKIIKHKARLNLHGGKQVCGINYFETYAPIVTWFTIRLMIVFGIIFCWALWQVDFVMAYPQAPAEMDIYMELPQGIKTATGNSKDHSKTSCRKPFAQPRRQHDKKGECRFQMNKSYRSKVVKRGLLRTPIWIL
jgi:hypothetical protein